MLSRFKKFKSILLILLWMTYATSIFLRRPELWGIWKAMGLAFLLTILACGAAIFLSGQYKQAKNR